MLPTLDVQGDRRKMARMLARIAIIVFALEALIMGTLSGWNLTQRVVLEGLTDATLLTISSTPVIYWWVVKPFVRSTYLARQALANELKIKALQAGQLEDTLAEKTRLLDQNEELSARLQHANAEVSEANERALQRIGADLHDGPAQLLSFAILRFGKLATLIETLGSPRDKEELHRMRSALTDTLREVRNISSGLSPPSIDTSSLSETISLAVAMHEEHTGTTVVLRTERLEKVAASKALKICTYRFIQEALSNSYRHAGGEGQIVTGTADGDRLIIVVKDRGPGFCPVEGAKKGLGLSGLRARIEALGGTLSIQSSATLGEARLTAEFELPAVAIQEKSHA